MKHRAILCPPPPPVGSIQPRDIEERYWEISLPDWPKGFELKIPLVGQKTAVYYLRASLSDVLGRETVHFYTIDRWPLPDLTIQELRRMCSLLGYHVS